MVAVPIRNAPEIPEEVVKACLEAFGARLSYWMKDRGVGVMELARATGIHHPNVSAMKAGRRKPSVENWRALSTALNVTLEQLVPDGVDLTPLEPELLALGIKMPPGPGKPLPAPPSIVAEYQEIQAPNLDGFLQRHAKDLKVTPRELFYLRNSRFRAEPWLTFDDTFWHDMLDFWRKYLKRQERSIF